MENGGQTERLKPEMAVFDIDGTIKRPGEPLSQEMVEGFRHLRDRKVITTISTGRPYVRMKEVLGDYFDEVIADDALISVEHGAKIVDKHGNVKVQSELGNKDIDKLLEFTGLNLDMVDQMRWNPADLSKKSRIWTPEPEDIEKIRAEKGWYADVFGGSLVEVKAMLYEESVSNVTLRLKEHIHVENLKLVFTGGSIKAIFQDGLLEYMKTKVSKARAIRYMCAYFGIYEHHLLVAGNAINDVDMLNMGAGHRVLVGEEGHGRETVLGYIYDTRDLIYINTPEDLGRYLQSL